MPSSAVQSPRTWILAVLFLACIDLAVTHTGVLWGVTRFEYGRDPSQLAFAQTYQAARAIYEPPAGAGDAVVFLGNSRIWLAARPAVLERELARLEPSPPPVENLGIFGANVGDLEMLSRHLVRRRAALVVIAVDGTDLLGSDGALADGLPARLLRIGWSNGPLPPGPLATQADRLARTVWPLYRFREFTRAAIDDRVWPTVTPEPFPDTVPSTAALFQLMYGERGAAVETAFRDWERSRTLDAFVRYQQATGGGNLALARARVEDARRFDAGSPGVAVLDALLARMAGAPWRTVILLVPENPILAEDRDGAFHMPGFSDRARDVVDQVATRHGITVVDGRAWMPARSFLDLDHVLPELSGVQRPLAEMIRHALRS
jgi:hypothetical protein